MYRFLFFFVMAFTGISGQAQNEWNQRFFHPSHEAKPWVFWYWMHGAVSKAGITKDLEAMKEVGLGGAYLMPIRDTTSKIPFQPTARQLSPAWWTLVDHAIKEADRLQLKLAMHLSDGFALAGGPWIQPEQSMQVLTWSDHYVSGGKNLSIQMPLPKRNEGYYKDIAVYAYPVVSIPSKEIPVVSSNSGLPAQFLADTSNTKETFKAEQSCTILYRYKQPITLRSIRIRTNGTNYMAHRLWVRASDDGIQFKTILRLEAPRAGWQDGDEDVTHAIPETNARYFQFEYQKEGAEPGSEELDAAKWKPNLKIVGLYLSEQPVLHQFESKNGSVWRLSKTTPQNYYSANQVVDTTKIITLTRSMKPDGRLEWNAPAGNWRIVRIGHTSNGHTNYTGGAALGLECDKFDPKVVTYQFENWLGQIYKHVDSTIAKRVLTTMHIDSWEAGSQNWTASFPVAFKKQHGYALTPFLLAMTGVPIQSLEASEQFLHDARATMNHLVQTAFFGTVQQLAVQKHWKLSAEAIAPTMISDGLQHFAMTDIPMGEFWWNSPTHDKPNDMLDAVSGAHIYGKNIVQAESFTTVRMDWSEHPGMLKSLGDRNLAIGANRLVFHVFTQNPWLDKKPGMTLDGVGLYYQRDQTWFKQSKAWIRYLTRTQSMLQYGKPVADIAVFIGEELPSRALLPSKLVHTLPGLMGTDAVDAESQRLLNEGQPMRSKPEGVSHSANTLLASSLINPLRGYAYDCLSIDVLLQAKVVKGQIELPSGASYKVLVIPYQHSLLPDSGCLSLQLAQKIVTLLQQGGRIMMHDAYNKLPGLVGDSNQRNKLVEIIAKHPNRISIPYLEKDLLHLGVKADVALQENSDDIAWNHRKGAMGDLYFISNQKESTQTFSITFRSTSRTPQLWDPLTGVQVPAEMIAQDEQTTTCRLTLPASGSCFMLFSKTHLPKVTGKQAVLKEEQLLQSGWTIQFNPEMGGPASPLKNVELFYWNESNNDSIRYYSGTVQYAHSISIHRSALKGQVRLQLSELHNIATVSVNGKEAGIIWTAPHQLDITSLLREGKNIITLEVTNTWANRLIGDHILPASQRRTYTTAPFRLEGKPLLPAGLGKVALQYFDLY